MTGTTQHLQPASPPPAGRTVVTDVLASIVVFMVALPLCIGIAQACGLGAGAGIVSGVVGGILIGSLAGSPLQVSGPAAGLIVLVIQFLDDVKAPHLAAGTSETEALKLAIPVLGLAILLAGVIQIVAGLCRLGQWFRAVSPAVVEGMLAGIGATIIAKQFHVLVGDAPPKGVLEGLYTIPQAAWKGISTPDGATGNYREAALIGVISIVILSTWKLWKWKPIKFVPAAVVAVLVAVLLNEFGRPVLESIGWTVGPAVETHGGIGVERVVVSSNLLDSLTFVRLPEWNGELWGIILQGAFTFAVIASAETLLCAVAVDTMHNGPRTRYDKELMAQGVGNMVCGAVGALPVTGVIVRSSANLDAGAKTRLSAILHGIWLVLFVMLLPGLLSRIPVAALAAVLVYTGWKLVNLPGLIHLWKQSRAEAVIFVATATTIVCVDLLAGVAAGVVLSAARLLWRFSHLGIRRVDDPEQRRVHLHLEGAATFLRLPVLAEALEAVTPSGTRLHIHLERVRLVDHAVMSLLTTFQKQFESKGGKLSVDWDQLKAHFQSPRLIEAETPPSTPQAEKPRVIDHLTTSSGTRL